MEVNLLNTTKICLFIVGMMLSKYSMAENANGFLIGVGAFGLASEDCEETDCAFGGNYLEFGYDFNEFIGVESKIGQGEITDKNIDADIKINYVGLNVGHDFNTDWYRLYAKVGYGKVEEDYFYNYLDVDDSYNSVGLGSRFTFGGDAQGVYLKVELTSVTYKDRDTAADFKFGIGYRF